MITSTGSSGLIPDSKLSWIQLTEGLVACDMGGGV